MFAQLMELLSNPLVLKVIIGYWVFSAFIGKMPSPAVVKQAFDDSKRPVSPLAFLAYQWFFAALHAMCGNLDRAAVAFKIPGAIEDKG